jgi:hypothetical protein
VLPSSASSFLSFSRRDGAKRQRASDGGDGDAGETERGARHEGTRASERA